MTIKSVLKFTVLGAFLSLGLTANAQESHFSQYYYAPMNLNPAMTGVFDGQYRVGVNYRDQWSSVPDAYKTMGFVADANFRKLGAGVNIVNTSAADGTVERLNATAGLSIDLSEPTASNHFIMGFSGGILQNTLNGNKIILEDGSSPASESNTDVDFSLGAMRFNGDNGTKMLPFLGASVSHINGPDNSFTGAGMEMPMRSTVHGGVRIQANNRLDITPHANFTFQGGARNMIIGTYVTYTMNNFGSHIMAGAMYRVEDSFTPYFGLKINNVQAGLSYDFNTSSLNDVIQDASSLELSLQYIIPNRKYQRVYTCPRL